MWLIAFVISFGSIIICCSKSCYGLEYSVPFARLTQNNLHFIIVVKMWVRNGACGINEARKRWLKKSLQKTHCRLCVCRCGGGGRGCFWMVKAKGTFTLAFCRRSAFLELSCWFRPVEVRIHDGSDGLLPSGRWGHGLGMVAPVLSKRPIFLPGENLTCKD